MRSPADPDSPSEAVPRSRRSARSTPKEQAWNNFLPVLSHAVRTPLNGILGMSRLLVQGKLPTEERRHAEVIHSSAESLLRLIDELLDLSRIEAGQFVLEQQDFELGELVRTVVELLKPRAQAKRLDLRYTVADAAPEALRGDVHRIRQVLLNLIKNGIKFTRRGFVFVTVTQEEAPEKERDSRVWIRFSVRDTGIGISEDFLPHIFEPFTQGDSSDTGSVGGNGVGLAISKGIVDLMNGEIDVESAPGRGSTFSFAVPLEPASRPESVAPLATLEAAGKSPSRRNRKSHRILVAEDDDVNRMLALRVLSEAGYQADAVHNGIKALEALEEKPYDLILMDCQMPELDGYEATRLLRQLEKGRQDAGSRHIPVIAVTALTMKNDRERCSAAGMDDFVAKPYRAEELVVAVDRHLGLSSGSVERPTSSPLLRDDSPVLDTGVFYQLRELSSPAQEGFLKALIETFVHERAERCEDLRQALARGEGRRLSKLAHKLISASGSIGAYRLAKMAGDLEIRAREDRLDECPKLLEDLVAEYDKAGAALREILDEP